MSGIIADGMGLLVVAIAPIPLIQKVAIFASFWIVSIFISVVTLHPVILSYIEPPPEHVPQAAKQPFINIWFARIIMCVAIGGAVGLHMGGMLPSPTIPYL